MRRFVEVSSVLAGAFLLIFVNVGCPSTEASIQCGPGTVLSGNTCLLVASAADAEAPPADAAPLGPTFEGVTSVAPASSTSLFVTWNDAQGTTAPERMRYQVFVAVQGSAIDYAKPTATTARGAVSAYLSRLEPGKPYDVAVRALDEADKGDSNVVVKSATTSADATPPTFAGVKSAEAAGSGAALLKWDAAQDDLTAATAMVYLVYVTAPPAAVDLSLPTLITRPGVTAATVTGLFDSAARYQFIVRARDAADNSDTNLITATSLAGPDTTPPVFDGCRTAVGDSAGSAVVSWEAATDDTTPSTLIAYDIYASSEAGELSFVTPFVTVTGKTNKRVTGLSSNKTWRFVCRARDFTGNHDENLIQRITKTFVDDTPPTFGGITLTEVDTLARTVKLSWDPGADDKTELNQIIYDVYEASAPGKQTFQGAPRASSLAGATTLVVNDLTPDSMLYWVVRARDQGGNHDKNTVEANSGEKIAVSFVRQVQPIFTHDCAVSGCHVPGNPMANLILAPGFAYNALVNVSSTQASGTLRVDPASPDTSYLFKKVFLNPPPFGWQMPAPATGSALSADEKEWIRKWIAQGSANN